MIAVTYQTWEELVGYLAAVSAMGVMLFFLPAIVELRKPKDAGPRILVDGSGSG